MIRAAEIGKPQREPHQQGQPLATCEAVCVDGMSPQLLGVSADVDGAYPQDRVLWGTMTLVCKVEAQLPFIDAKIAFF